MKDHVRDNILNMITPFTREKIHQLTLYHFKLWNKTGDIFLTLLYIFSKEDNILNFNRLKFKTQLKNLEFLQTKNLIDSNNKITTLGIIVVLSHKLDISIFSVFILSKLYNAQIIIRLDNGIPYPILEQWFESFPTVTHTRINISDMTRKGILDNNLRYRLAGINLEKLGELKKYDKHLKEINHYVDDVSEKIENLISTDPQVTSFRNKNLEMYVKTGINFV